MKSRVAYVYLPQFQKSRELMLAMHNSIKQRPAKLVQTDTEFVTVIRKALVF